MATGHLITRLSAEEAEVKAKYNGNHNLLVVEKESQVQILVGEDGQVTSPLFWKVKFQNHALIL